MGWKFLWDFLKQMEKSLSLSLESGHLTCAFCLAQMRQLIISFFSSLLDLFFILFPYGWAVKFKRPWHKLTIIVLISEAFPLNCLVLYELFSFPFIIEIKLQLKIYFEMSLSLTILFFSFVTNIFYRFEMWRISSNLVVSSICDN